MKYKLGDKVYVITKECDYGKEVHTYTYGKITNIKLDIDKNIVYYTIVNNIKNIAIEDAREDRIVSGIDDFKLDVEDAIKGFKLSLENICTGQNNQYSIALYKPTK